ncbi:MAG TPA: DUF885 domain-containing protein [Gammaproteobacteria bacterium]|nr:DUF885 domain-containing protein [Gammaproteobacteria bacterium]
MLRIIIRSALIATFCTGVLAYYGTLHHGAAAATAGDDDARFSAAEHRYVVFVLQRFPAVATYLGGAAFDPALADIDGKLRDYSPQALQTEQAELAAFRAQFAAFDADRLSPQWRIDRSVALAQMDFMLHEQEVRRYQQRSLDSYLDEPVWGVDWQIQGMTTTGATTYGTAAEWHAVLTRTEAIPAYLATAEKQLGAGVLAGNTPDWRMLAAGLKTAQSDAGYFSKTLPQLAAQDDPSAPPADLAALQAAGNAAAAAYAQLHAFLAKTFFEDPAAKGAAALKPAYRADRFAFGEAEYDWALRNNLHLTATAGDLFTASWPVVVETQDSMVSLARQIAAQHGWPAPAEGSAAVRLVFEKLSLDAPATDAAMLEGYREVGERLVAYARSTRLFDTPPDYKLDVRLTPEPLRNSVGVAGFYPAPPFKQAGIGRFYITPTGDDVTALHEEHDFPSMAVLAGHEGFPGHALHYDVMTHWRDQISPVRWLTPGAVEDSSSMWQDSMAIEGWAFYSEAVLAEPQPGAPQGFYTPEERLYQLRGKLLRDLRVRIDTGIHTGRMTFDDAVDLFSNTVDFLPGSCRDKAALADALKQASCDAAYGEISRYARWPTQAITYRVGKEQILALRRRAEQEMGKAFSMRVFHLTLMTQGTIPVTYFGDELIKSMEYAD